MQLTVDSKTLAAALKTVQPAVARAGHSPVLAGVLLSAAEDMLLVAASNLDLTIEHVVDVDVTTPGSVVVSASTLARVVQAVAGGRVTVTADDLGVSFEGTGAHATLPTMPVDEWPRLDVTDLDPAATLTADDVAMLRHIVYAASTDQSRPVLCGVQFRGGIVQATDSYRGAFASFPTLPDRTVNVPAVALKAMLAKVDDTAEVALGARLARFTAGSTTWTTRIIESEAPDLPQLWRDESPVEFTVPAADLLDAMERVSSLTPDSPVKVAGDGSQVTLTVAAQDVGEVSATVTVTSGEPIPFGVNGAYFADLLEHVTVDEVTVGLVDGQRPVTVAVDGVHHIVMPVRFV